jgi:formate C-acetyltransferase
MTDFNVKTNDINALYPDPDQEKYKEQGIHNMENLIRTGLNDYGIMHLQFNFQDKDVLRDAQRCPEKYPTLMVRVAGYSVYFTDLNTVVQNDIIDRTEHHF